MGFALLLLGLLPLFFLGDLFTGGDSDEADGDAADTQSANAPAQVEGGDTADMMDLLDPLAAAQARAADEDEGGDVLAPITDDATPFEAEDDGDGAVIKPITDDPEPFLPSEVNPDEVLKPIDDPLDDRSDEGLTSLQQLIKAESALSAGVERLEGDAAETVHLGDGEDHFVQPEDDDGAAQLDSAQGTPILHSLAPVDVVDAGDGDDTVIGSDDAIYAFGGAGDDTLHAGDGGSALFGGTGQDDLSGGAGDDFADGGAGHDDIAGGDGDDRLFGGGHSADAADRPDDDTIDGGAGDDDIAGGFGADVLRGGTGDDVINHHGRVEEELSWERSEFDWHLDGAADRLAGGDGNDTLIMDRMDQAEGGAGVDTFWVYAETGEALPPAEILDFESGQDFLRITLAPDTVGDDPDLVISQSENGEDSLVSLNGDVIAVLRGASDVTDVDLRVEIFDRVYA